MTTAMWSKAFTRFISMSIRIQLLIVILLLMVPLAALVLYSILDRRDHAINAAMVSTLELASGVASEKQQLVTGAQQLASTLAQLPEVEQKDGRTLQPILARLLRLNSQYVNITITDRNGTIWASAIPLSKEVSLAERRHVATATATGRFSSGEYLIGKITGKPLLPFAHPLYDRSGGFAGTIVISLDLDQFNYLPGTNYPPGTSIALLDYKGTILGRTVDNDRYKGKQLDSELFARIQSLADGSSFRAVGLDGIEWFSSHRKLFLEGEASPYLYVRAAIPVDAALGKVQQEVIVAAGLSLTALCLAFVLVWVVAKRSIVDRVHALELACGRVAEGDLGVQTADAVTGGELGRLAVMFDTMAGRLAVRDREMKKAQEKVLQSHKFISSLLNAYTESTHLMTPDGTIVVANEAMARQVGRDLSEVIGGNIFELRRPELAETRKRYIGQLLERRKPLIFYDRDNGRDIMNSLYPVVDDQEKVTHIAVINMDITHLKNTERELIASRNMLQELNHRLETTREQERRHIAREIHDTMGQSLTVLKLDTAWLTQECAPAGSKAAARGNEMMALIDSLVGAVQTLSAELAPTLLELGLAAAIEWHGKEFQRRTGIPCLMMLDDRVNRAVNREHETMVFRIYQEAMTNVIRHAEASEVTISLCTTPSAAILEVADNGKGIAPDSAYSPASLGLHGMRERAAICGATFAIRGMPGGGTIVKVEVPYQSKEASHEEDTRC